MKSEERAKRAAQSEGRELAKLAARREKGNYRGYIIVILLIITAVNIIDEISTGISGSVQSSYITEFFVNGTVFGRSYSYEEGLALHTTISLVSYVIGLISPFYKALADRVGRKPLLVFSTFGMSIGMLVTYFSNSYFVFMIGTGITGFFIGHDIQIIYILEESPSHIRGRVYSVLKSIGIMGTVAVPMLRRILMGNDPTLWRRIFLVPSLAGLAAVLLVLFFARETGVYIEERTAYLEKTPEQREAEALEKKAAAQKGGVFNAIKYIFRHRQTRVLVISHMIFDTAIVAMALYYESIMHVAGMSTEEITSALLVLPFIYAAMTFLSGFVADGIGRKKTVLIASVICLFAFVGFITSTNLLWNPYVVGILFGLYMGGYWIGRDYMSIMLTEKVPTDIRASVVGAEGLLVTLGMAVGYACVVIGVLFMPIWVTCLIVSVPCIVVSVILFTVKVGETKGADMHSVKAE